MKIFRTVIYSLVGLLAAVALLSLLRVVQLGAEVREEKREASQTAQVVAGLVGGDGITDQWTFEDYVRHLVRQKQQEEHELREWWWSGARKRLDRAELRLLDELIDLLIPSEAERSESIEPLVRELAWIDEQEIVLLRGERRDWMTRFFWTGGVFLMLTLAQGMVSLRAHYGGAGYVTTLGQARTRFGADAAASRYLVKRRSVDAYEARAITEAIRRLPGVKRILDIPCGTGRFIPLFDSMGLEYHGADSSQAMVDLAQRQWSQSDPDRILRCDILNIPFPDRWFDSIVVIRLLHHVSTPDQRVAIFRQLARKARVGVVATFFDARSLSHLFYVVRSVLTLQPLRRSALSTGQLRRELRQAGLELTHVHYRLRAVHRYAVLVAVPLPVERSVTG